MLSMSGRGEPGLVSSIAARGYLATEAETAVGATRARDISLLIKKKKRCMPPPVLVDPVAHPQRATFTKRLGLAAPEIHQPPHTNLGHRSKDRSRVATGWVQGWGRQLALCTCSTKALGSVLKRRYDSLQRVCQRQYYDAILPSRIAKCLYCPCLGNLLVGVTSAIHSSSTQQPAPLPASLAVPPWTSRPRGRN
jgi:hypothetical protein